VTDWRTAILKQLSPGVSRLTIVADPDGLLLEEGLLQEVISRGFELIQFEDSVSFRFAYESRFRSRWDQGEDSETEIVLRYASGDLAGLPYDLLQSGRTLAFNLGDMFPNLSYGAVASLDRGYLDDLYRAQAKHCPVALGDNATKDFILYHVFGIAPEVIDQPSDLLRILLRRHYKGQRIPSLLEERFVQVLKQEKRFEDWPLEEIIPNREAFFAFLSERWPSFLDRLSAIHPQKASNDQHYDLKFRGPLDLPFEHDDVRPYIDSLFLEGFLDPVGHEAANALVGTWAAIGVRTDPEEDQQRRLKRLLTAVETSMPQPDARHDDWLLFAYRWAELITLRIGLGMKLPKETLDGIEDVQRLLDTVFLEWVLNRYSSLHNLPAVPPVMIHHVPRFLASLKEETGKKKFALVIVDGLALDQWLVMKSVIAGQVTDLHFQERAVFAWLPTITSVSRQSAFSGRLPLYFPASIHNTQKEGSLWIQFWTERELKSREVEYARAHGETDLDGTSEMAANPEISVLGVVIDKIDKIMHGMELGAAGLHNQVRLWATQGYFAKLLEMLLDNGFHVTVTSDHGNIEATGCGRPMEGVTADVRGQRVRVFSDPALRSTVKARFPGSIEWPPVGLPGDFLPLMAPGRSAFITDGEKSVCHGGISIEELIVPFVQIERGQG